MTTRAAAAPAGPGAANVALKWLDNPIIIWGGGALLVGAGLLWLIPNIYESGKKGAKTAFNDLSTGASTIVDKTREQASYFIGQPKTQDPVKRDSNDWFQGLFVESDRGLSDVWDKATGWL